MKNVSYSTILFSAFSPDAFLSPVRNKINHISLSVKTIIKNQNKKNKKLFTHSSSLNISNTSKYNIIQKKFYNTYIIDKNNNIKETTKDSKQKLYNWHFPNSTQREKTFKLSKKFNKDFIFISSKRSESARPLYKKIKMKNGKSQIEPYKRYLIEKNKIELNRRAKEVELNYIYESKRQQKLKMENDIKNKYQGLDFSRQKPRDFHLDKYLKSTKYNHRIKNKTNENDSKFEFKNLLKRLNFETKEKRYMFLENNEFVPKVRYSSFNEKLKNFYRNLNVNPQFKNLINYISKK